MEKKWKEICITFRGFWQSDPPAQLFKTSITEVCHYLGKHTDVYFIYPELTKMGVLHYHVLLEYNAPKSVKLSDALGHFQRRFGRTAIYDVDDECTEWETNECKCFVCRHAYMSKDLSQMKELLKINLPITKETYDVYFTPMDALRRQRKSLLRQKASLLTKLAIMGIEGYDSVHFA